MYTDDTRIPLRCHVSAHQHCGWGVSGTCGKVRMRAAAARRSEPAVLPRRGRSGLCWGEEPLAGALLAGDGMSSALNSSAVNRSHSREREKCGAWLCRRASDVASATRPYTGSCRRETRRMPNAMMWPWDLVHLTSEATWVRPTVLTPQKDQHESQQPYRLCRWQGNLLHRAALSMKQVNMNHVAFYHQPCDQHWG